jgi:hypothetical protein
VKNPHFISGLFLSWLTPISVAVIAQPWKKVNNLHKIVKIISHFIEIPQRENRELCIFTKAGHKK